MFVRMMLVRLINVSFARIMPIWLVAILKQMKPTVNQLRPSLAPKMFVFTFNPIYNPYFFKWVFCLFAKTLNDRNENKYTETFFHIQFSITISKCSQKFLIYVIKYTFVFHYAVIFCSVQFRAIIQQSREWQFQIRIKDTVKYLGWWFFAKILNAFQQLNIFA